MERKVKVAVEWRRVEANVVTAIAEMTVKIGRRRDFKRKSNKNSRDFEGKGNKRPHHYFQWKKKNEFVIRNKGDK